MAKSASSAISNPDNFEDFKTWHADFLDRHSGYSPKNINVWWHRVESSHKKLRDFIGGIRVIKEYTLKAHQNPASPEDVYPIVDEILKLVPNYLADYGYSKDVFLRPTIEQGSHNVIKVAKHVRIYCDSFHRNNINRHLVLAELDKKLSILGEVWAKCRTSDSKLEITLSTSPRSFALLGHYGPDADSCFRQGSDKTQHKWVVGQTADTFVVTIGQWNDKKNKYTNVARCFGYTNKDYSVFNFANYYYSPGFNEGDAVGIIRQLLTDLWGSDPVFYEEKSVIYDIFHNPYGRWTFSQYKNPIPTQELHPLLSNILRFTCPNCGYEDKSDKYWGEVDDDIVCQECTSHAFVCEVTNVLTFKPLIDYVQPDGDSLMVHPNVVKNVKVCNSCNRPFKGDGDICSQCTEIEYSECDICGALVKDDEIIDLGEFAICHKCIKEQELEMFAESLQTL